LRLGLAGCCVYGGRVFGGARGRSHLAVIVLVGVLVGQCRSLFAARFYNGGVGAFLAFAVKASEA